jgi:acetyl-CoA acetyltransferase
MMLSRKVAIAGVYESPRRDAPNVHPFAIQMECLQGALEDAGLDLRDVDGLCAASGDWSEGGGVEDITELAEYLGVRPSYFDSTDVGGCSYVVHLGNAMAAIAAGQANVVVISYASCPRWWPLQTPPSEPLTLPAGPGQFEAPYEASLIAGYALFAQRHIAAYGTTPEQLASVAVTFRNHARFNPGAFKQTPVTIEDVLDSPVIASPIRRLDCCVVTDSGGAIVVTSAERAGDCRARPVYVAGYGGALDRIQLSQIDRDLVTPGFRSGQRAFAMAGLRPADVDVAQLYDAFTISPLLALEDLGFCKRGESGPFAANGGLSVGGMLPCNTDGGGLSSNHPGKRGIFTLIECVRQLRGTGPGVQVDNPEVALAHAIGGTLSAAATAILTV